MAIKLKDKLAAMKQTEFKFTSFEKKVSSADESGNRMIYLVLHLEDVIPMVTGSNSLYDPDSNARQHYVQSDVTMVSVNIDILDKYESEFTFLEENDKLVGPGSYAGDLMLDIARSGDVWLTDTKFSKMSGDFKRNKRKEEFSRMVTKAMGDKGTN